MWWYFLFGFVTCFLILCLCFWRSVLRGIKAERARLRTIDNIRFFEDSNK